MKGSDLKKIVKDSGLTIDEIAEKSGIPRRTVSSLYDKEYVEKHYLDKLAFLLQKDAKHDGSHISPRPSAELYEKMIDLFQQQFDMINDLVKKNDEDTSIYRDIVRAALDTGAMTFKDNDKFKDKLKKI